MNLKRKREVKSFIITLILHSRKRPKDSSDDYQWLLWGEKTKAWHNLDGYSLKQTKRKRKS